MEQMSFNFYGVGNFWAQNEAWFGSKIMAILTEDIVNGLYGLVIVLCIGVFLYQNLVKKAQNFSLKMLGLQVLLPVIFGVGFWVNLPTSIRKAEKIKIFDPEFQTPVGGIGGEEAFIFTKKASSRVSKNPAVVDKYVLAWVIYSTALGWFIMIGDIWLFLFLPFRALLLLFNIGRELALVKDYTTNVKVSIQDWIARVVFLNFPIQIFERGFAPANIKPMDNMMFVGLWFGCMVLWMSFIIIRRLIIIKNSLRLIKKYW
jgi:hypothetical protein